MHRLCVWLAAATFYLMSAEAKDLKIFFIDVEGGQCTLIVSPKGETLLIDTGWPGNNSRDAERILAVAKKNKIKKIDWLLITHFHTDHLGGITTLMDRLPVVNLLSHGKNIETGKGADQMTKLYEEAKMKSKETILKPGAQIPIAGLEIEVISAAGETIPGASRLARGAGDNALCGAATKKVMDTGENARSVGFLLKFGEFRFLDLGDLTWNKEMEVACPVNKVGKVDLYLTTHHGMFSSNNPALVHALNAKAMVMNNGDKKGGDAAAIDSLRAAPDLQNFWQLHYAIAAGKEHNVDDPYIANLTAPGGFNIEVVAKMDGHFTVTNQRNKFNKSY